MHDRIRLALSAAFIAAVTLLAAGRPLPLAHADAHADTPVAAAVEGAPTTGVAPVAVDIPVAAPKAEQPAIRAPRLRRTAGADLSTA